MGSMSRVAKWAATAGLCLALSACAPIIRQHGYVPPEEDLAALTVGKDTRESVAAAVGRPSTEGILDNSGWYYVESRFRHFGAAAPREIEREVVAISFDARGRVANIERFGLEDGRAVVLSRRVTDSNVKGLSFIQQLMGNFGRLTADQIIQ